jgi:hypothetical protein
MATPIDWLDARKLSEQEPDLVAAGKTMVHVKENGKTVVYVFPKEDSEKEIVEYLNETFANEINADKSMRLLSLRKNVFTTIVE